jgi:hypothetical protein
MIYELDRPKTKSFKSMIEYDPNIIMVVDGLNLAFNNLEA